MNTYFLFGKYNTPDIKEISSDRTHKANEIIGSHNGKVKSIYALLGEYDVIIIAEFPTVEDAMKASLSLAQLTGISFSTHPAVTVEYFDKMINDLE